MFLDQGDGLDAIFSLTYEVNFGETPQQECEFIAGWLFVIDDNCVDGHKAAVSIGGGCGTRNCGSIRELSDSFSGRFQDR
jgi:hypothetical protein